MSDPAVPADSTRTCVESYGSGRYHTKPVLCVNVSILYIIISENSWNKNKDKKKVWTKKTFHRANKMLAFFIFEGYNKTINSKLETFPIAFRNHHFMIFVVLGGKKG